MKYCYLFRRVCLIYFTVFSSASNEKDKEHFLDIARDTTGLVLDNYNVYNKEECWNIYKKNINDIYHSHLFSENSEIMLLNQNDRNYTNDKVMEYTSLKINTFEKDKFEATSDDISSLNKLESSIENSFPEYIKHIIKMATLPGRIILPKQFDINDTKKIKETFKYNLIFTRMDLRSSDSSSEFDKLEIMFSKKFLDLYAKHKESNTKKCDGKRNVNNITKYFLKPIAELSAFETDSDKSNPNFLNISKLILTLKYLNDDDSYIDELFEVFKDYQYFKPDSKEGNVKRKALIKKILILKTYLSLKNCIPSDNISKFIIKKLRTNIILNILVNMLSIMSFEDINVEDFSFFSNSLASNLFLLSLGNYIFLEDLDARFNRIIKADEKYYIFEEINRDALRNFLVKDFKISFSDVLNRKLFINDKENTKPLEANSGVDDYVLGGIKNGVSSVLNLSNFLGNNELNTKTLNEKQNFEEIKWAEKYVQQDRVDDFIDNRIINSDTKYSTLKKRYYYNLFRRQMNEKIIQSFKKATSNYISHDDASKFSFELLLEIVEICNNSTELNFKKYFLDSISFFDLDSKQKDVSLKINKLAINNHLLIFGIDKYRDFLTIVLTAKNHSELNKLIGKNFKKINNIDYLFYACVLCVITSIWLGIKLYYTFIDSKISIKPKKIRKR